MDNAMRVLQLPVSYLPWTVGGKEVFCHGLSRHLLELGLDVRVALHQNLLMDEPLGETQYETVPVHVLPPIRGQKTRAAVYSCEPLDVSGFDALLRKFRPQIVHFHDFSVGANLLHMRLARASGARVVMSYHSPGQSCLQRSLLYRGKVVCDGEIRPLRCSACRLGVMGIPSWIGFPLATVPRLGLNANSSSRVIRALTARAMTDRFRLAWAECIASVDRFQVHADWVAELLEKNGVFAKKLVMIRSGWSNAKPKRSASRPTPSAKLRLAFVGRCDPVKGAHVLIQAVRMLDRDVSLRVFFYGPYWEDDYGQRLLKLIGGDRRFEPPRLVEPSRMTEVLAAMDACVVPSLSLETGPLVILEAFAAGVPVVGSRLGGIAELVRDGHDGILFKPGDVDVLARLLSDFIQKPEQLARLRNNVREPRTMADVARDMQRLYRKLVIEVA